ncbi:MAG: type II toxin-antitoxin system RelE/ParE family toxin [bacterium]|nr:type II toxin-antitoxin system RelE/ParE family toxin [bacterium]
MTKQEVRILPPAKEYIESIPGKDQGAVAADIKTMQSGDFDSISTKQLKGPVRELIVGVHRISYFSLQQILWFVHGFRKKTRKAPRNEIEYAGNVYKTISNTFKKTNK